MQKHATRNHRHHDTDLGDDLIKIKAALRHATRDIQDRANEAFSNSYDDLKDKSFEMRENVGDYIADKPLKSVGFAVLAGLVIGFLLKKS